jgi:integral membrane protein (TIGR00529 family)
MLDLRFVGGYAVFELLKLFLVFLLIVILIKRKISLGLSILSGGFFLGFLFGLSLFQMFKHMGIAAIEWPTIHLLIVILLILVFGEFLKHLKSLESLSTGLENLFKSTKLLLMFLPATIGILPMPAGAMMSAPMVEQVGSRRNLPPDVKMVVNYWFRHILEFFWPLYLGVVMTASLLNITLREVILAQILLSLAMIGGGVLFCSSKIKIDDGRVHSHGGFYQNLKLALKGILPVLVVVGFNLAFSIDIALALGLTLLLFGLIRKIHIMIWWRMIRRAITLEMVILILSVMIFKKLITVSGAIETIPNSLANFGISPVVAVLIVPFTVGILTGMTSAFVGISYPVLFSLLKPDGVNYGYMMLAYGAGFAGVMLSPVHLCLVVTKSYFKASFSSIYRMLLPASLFLIVFALTLALLGFPWGKIG